jgi:hypothetical protein
MRTHQSMLGLACIVVSAQSAIAQDQLHRSADVVAGRPSRLAVLASVSKDCAPGPLPEIRVTVPPRHGSVFLRQGMSKAGALARCPTLHAKTRSSGRRFLHTAVHGLGPYWSELQHKPASVNAACNHCAKRPAASVGSARRVRRQARRWEGRCCVASPLRRRGPARLSSTILNLLILRPATAPARLHDLNPPKGTAR